MMAAAKPVESQSQFLVRYLKSWFVNGRKVFGIDADIPRIPGRLYANIWAADPSIANWAGNADPALQATSVIKSISFRPYQTPDS